MPRTCLFVGDIGNSSDADLSQLIGKLATVVSVRRPTAGVTGHPRQFAHVIIDGNEEAADKCVRAFNNSRWKSNRIRVQLGKEFYADRLAREKSELQELQAQQAHEEQQRAAELKACHAAATIPATLKLRSMRGGPLVDVSTEPILVTEKGKTPKQDKLTAKKRRFELDSSDDVSYSDIRWQYKSDRSKKADERDHDRSDDGFDEEDTARMQRIERGEMGDLEIIWSDDDQSSSHFEESDAFSEGDDEVESESLEEAEVEVEEEEEVDAEEEAEAEAEEEEEAEAEADEEEEAEAEADEEEEAEADEEEEEEEDIEDADEHGDEDSERKSEVDDDAEVEADHDHSTEWMQRVERGEVGDIEIVWDDDDADADADDDDKQSTNMERDTEDESNGEFDEDETNDKEALGRNYEESDASASLSPKSFKDAVELEASSDNFNDVMTDALDGCNDELFYSDSDDNDGDAAQEFDGEDEAAALDKAQCQECGDDLAFYNKKRMSDAQRLHALDEMRNRAQSNQSVARKIDVQSAKSSHVRFDDDGGEDAPITSRPAALRSALTEQKSAVADAAELPEVDTRFELDQRFTSSKKRAYPVSEGELSFQPVLDPEDIPDETIEEETARSQAILSQILGKSMGNTTKQQKQMLASKKQEKDTMQPQSASRDEHNKQVPSAAVRVPAGRPAPIPHSEREKTFTNTNTLKDIFHKKDLALKLQKDAVFQAAEEIGIDILGQRKQTDAKTLQFNFFDAQPQQVAGDVAASDVSQGFAPITETTRRKTNAVASDMDENTTPVAPTKSLPAILSELSDQSPGIWQLDFQMMASAAKAFMPEKSTSQLRKEWRVQRETLAKDYKRKRKHGQKVLANRQALAGKRSRR